MKIKINELYTATKNFNILGYVGETNARTIDIVQPLVENADTYRLRFEYSDGTVYDVEIVDGFITLTAAILRGAGTVDVQWLATKQNGDSYDLVAKSQVFELKIGESISDDVAPIPTLDVAVSALEEIKSNVQQVADAAAEINSTANAVENTAQQIDSDYREIMSAKSEVASNAETARTAAVSAQAGAELAKQYAEKSGGASDEYVDIDVIDIEEDTNLFQYKLSKPYKKIYVYISQYGVATKATGAIKATFTNTDKAVDEVDCSISGVAATASYCNYVICIEHKGSMSISQMCREMTTGTTSNQIYLKPFLKMDENNFYVGDFNLIKLSNFKLKPGTKIYIKGVPAESEVN